MVSKERQCRFKSLVRIRDKLWEWCSLYNAEISKLDCNKCLYKGLYDKPLRTREEIIS